MTEINECAGGGAVFNMMVSRGLIGAGGEGVDQVDIGGKSKARQREVQRP